MQLSRSVPRLAIAGKWHALLVHFDVDALALTQLR